MTDEKNSQLFFCSSFRLSTMGRQEIENFLHFHSWAIVAVAHVKFVRS